MSIGAHGSQKMKSGSLQLKLQTNVICHMGAGNLIWSSEKVASSLSRPSHQPHYPSLYLHFLICLHKYLSVW